MKGRLSGARSNLICVHEDMIKETVSLWLEAKELYNKVKLSRIRYREGKIPVREPNEGPMRKLSDNEEFNQYRKRAANENSPRTENGNTEGMRTKRTNKQQLGITNKNYRENLVRFRHNNNTLVGLSDVILKMM